LFYRASVRSFVPILFKSFDYLTICIARYRRLRVSILCFTLIRDHVYICLFIFIYTNRER